MNEQLENALVQVINKSIDGIDAAAGFLSAEIPDVLSQLLVWHGFYNLMLTLLGLFLIWFSYKVIWPIKYDVSKDEAQAAYKNGELWTRCSPGADVTSTRYELIISGMINWPTKAASFLIALAGLSFVNVQWLQIWIAPKVWLLEYAASLTK